MLQMWAKAVYDSHAMQCLSALLVLGNFVANVVQFEVLPEEGSEAAQTFAAIEMVFTIVFAMELSINMLANWFRAFWSDAWNLVDFAVVLISIASMFLDELPGVSMLRLIRVFRVVRLFKRLESLRTIVEALVGVDLPPPQQPSHACKHRVLPPVLLPSSLPYRTLVCMRAVCRQPLPSFLGASGLTAEPPRQTSAILPVANAFFVLILIASLYAGGNPCASPPGAGLHCTPCTSGRCRLRGGCARRLPQPRSYAA